MPSSDPRQKATVPSGEPIGAGPTWAVKVTDWPLSAGLSEVFNVIVVGTTSPIPDSGICCVAGVALLVMVMAPVSVPETIGAKITLSTQDWPGMRVVLEVQVASGPAKLKSPVMAKLLNERLALPLLVTEMSCGAESSPAMVLANRRGGGPPMTRTTSLSLSLK